MTTTAPPDEATATATIASRLQTWAEREPDGVALRDKQLGVWREITYGEYWEAVQTVAHALLALGIAPGDRVAVHSENRPEWVVTDVAAVAVRGATMGLYPTNPWREVQYLLADSGARVLVAEDQEQVDKALAAGGTLDALEHIVYIEPRGIRRRYDDPRLLSWPDFLEIGRRHREQHPRAVAERMAAAGPDDLAALVYTSGTTGPPKGAMLSAANVEFATNTGMGHDGFIEPPLRRKDFMISYLPLCHVYERAFSVWFALASGATINFAESIDTIQQDLREVQPTVLQSVPRIYGEDVRRDPGEGCVCFMAQEPELRNLDEGLGPHRAHARGAGGPAHRLDASAVRAGLGVPLPRPQGEARAAPVPARYQRHSPYRPRDSALLHGRRCPHVRGIWHDGELRDRDQQQSATGQARHRR